MNNLNIKSIIICSMITIMSCTNHELNESQVKLSNDCFNIPMKFKSEQKYGQEFDCEFTHARAKCISRYSYYLNTNKIKVATANRQFSFTKTEELTIPEVSNKPIIVLKNYILYVSGFKEDTKCILISWINYQNSKNNMILDKDNFFISNYNRSWEIGDKTVFVESNLSYTEFNRLYPSYKGNFKKSDYDSVSVDWKYYNESGDVRKFFDNLKIYQK